ncbi:MAG: TlpA disulfide reductase family protein [Methylovulum sp.]|nr:TlpA disulfide reductase family protein [Methylovulum sp.]
MVQSVFSPKQTLFVLLAAIALMLLLWLVNNERVGRLLDTPAPEVTFTTITGQNVALKALRGKPAIVTFWATDCPACIKEIPHLRALYRRYHAQGLEIVAVAMHYDPPSHVIAMTQEQQLPYLVALDLNAQHAHAFGDVMLTPSTFLISPDSAIVLNKTGAFDYADMQKQIEHFLKG